MAFGGANKGLDAVENTELDKVLAQGAHNQIRQTRHSHSPAVWSGKSWVYMGEPKVTLSISKLSLPPTSLLSCVSPKHKRKILTFFLMISISTSPRKSVLQENAVEFLLSCDRI